MQKKLEMVLKIILWIFFYAREHQVTVNKIEASR